MLSDLSRFAELGLVDRFRRVNLLDFSVDIFTNCLNRSLYRRNWKQYAETYFYRARINNSVDDVYGMFSPYFFVIYHNDPRLLAEILQTRGYQIKFCSDSNKTALSDAMTPLEYCFLMKRTELIKVFCLYFAQNKFTITKNEFDLLLADGTVYAHDALSQLAEVPEIADLPTFSYSRRPLSIHSFDRKFEIVEQIRRDNSGRVSQARGGRIISDPSLSRHDIEVKMVPFKVNFHRGTSDSLNLIRSFIDSESDRFVASDWRHIIRYFDQSQVAVLETLPNFLWGCFLRLYGHVVSVECHIRSELSAGNCDFGVKRGALALRDYETGFILSVRRQKVFSPDISKTF